MARRPLGGISKLEQWERQNQQKHHAKRVARVKSTYSTQPAKLARRRKVRAPFCPGCGSCGLTAVVAQRKERQHQSLVELTNAGSPMTTRSPHNSFRTGRGHSTSVKGRGKATRHTARRSTQHSDSGDEGAPRSGRRTSLLVAGGADFVVDSGDEEAPMGGKRYLPGSSSVPILPDLGPRQLAAGKHRSRNARQVQSTSQLPSVGNHITYQQSYQQSLSAYASDGNGVGQYA